jgi:ATP-binding cassette subfamily B protein
LWKYRLRLSLGVLFVGISNLFAIFPVKLISSAFDLVLETINTHRHFEGTVLQSEVYSDLVLTLFIFAGLVIGFSILKGVFLYFMRWTIIIMSRLIEYDLKNTIYQHYQQLDQRFYRINSTGDLMNRISEDVSRVRMYFGPAIMYTINLLVLFALVISTMVSISPKLTLYVLAPLPVLTLGIYYVSQIINRQSEKVQRQLSALSTFVQESFSGIRVIKTYNQHIGREKHFDMETEEYKRLTLQLVKTEAWFQPLMILLIGLSTILTVFIGGSLALEGQITMGNIAEFVIYVNMLTWPVASLGWVTSLVQRAAASQERINEFLDTQPSISNPNPEGGAPRGNIVFENVSFTYPTTHVTALRNISFAVKEGQSLAITGKTGSGKSSIAQLLLRFYDVSAGRILIDGIDLREVNLGLLRAVSGYVPQDVFLFSDTVSGNIKFGNQAASQKEIEEAAAAASVAADIEQLPNKYETQVGERGISLSGGQKQRISIARALIGQPKLLIFDDCLSAVDTDTERHILAHLQEKMKGKTSILISHRISTIMHCEQIIVLDNGSIAEQGTHNELLKKQGHYSRMYQQQISESSDRLLS